MSVLVVGSVAYDSVRTPQGHREDELGGSATYFSVSASYFDQVSVTAVAGNDVGSNDLKILKSHNINIKGLVIAKGKTFRWAGEYGEDMNSCVTLDTQLNVLAQFRPKLTTENRKSPFLFLANIDPELQLNVLNQMIERPSLVAGDTMNFWIEGKKAAIEEVIKTVDVFIINEGEARLLASEGNLIKAAKLILARGPKLVVIKRGEYGAMGFTRSAIFTVPAYPVETVVDPTGAGDSFAGGFMGYIAATNDFSPNGFHRAMAVGSVMASFTVESFGLRRLHSLKLEEVQERFHELQRLTDFKGLDVQSLPTIRSSNGHQ